MANQKQKRSPKKVLNLNTCFCQKCNNLKLTFLTNAIDCVSGGVSKKVYLCDNCKNKILTSNNNLKSVSNLRSTNTLKGAKWNFDITLKLTIKNASDNLKLFLVVNYDAKMLQKKDITTFNITWMNGANSFTRIFKTIDKYSSTQLISAIVYGRIAKELKVTLNKDLCNTNYTKVFNKRYIKALVKSNDFEKIHQAMNLIGALINYNVYNITNDLKYSNLIKKFENETLTRIPAIQ